MPQRSLSTLATGARPLVVQEALEMMWCLAGSYLSSFTPSTTVMSSFLAGAEMMTFFTVSCRCAFALVASVKKPVLSMTIWAPSSPQGISRGVFAARRRESSCR